MVLIWVRPELAGGRQELPVSQDLGVFYFWTKPWNSVVGSVTRHDEWILIDRLSPTWGMKTAMTLQHLATVFRTRSVWGFEGWKLFGSQVGRRAKKPAARKWAVLHECIVYLCTWFFLPKWNMRTDLQSHRLTFSRDIYVARDQNLRAVAGASRFTSQAQVWWENPRFHQAWVWGVANKPTETTKVKIGSRLFNTKQPSCLAIIVEESWHRSTKTALDEVVFVKKTAGLTMAAEALTDLGAVYSD